ENLIHNPVCFRLAFVAAFEKIGHVASKASDPKPVPNTLKATVCAETVGATLIGMIGNSTFVFGRLHSDSQSSTGVPVHDLDKALNEPNALILGQRPKRAISRISGHVRHVKIWHPIEF